MTDLLPGQAEAIAEVNDLRQAISKGDPRTLDLILGKAHTHFAWTDRKVDETTLRAAFDLARMGPTSMNCQPMRLVWVRSAEAKARLIPHMMEGNREKTAKAPVTAIVAHDTAFYTQFGRNFPINPGAAGFFAGNAELAQVTAFRNATLQAAYLIIALRAHGLDVGGMSGFDNPAVDVEFLGGTTFKSNFLMNVGYGDAGTVFPRLPRFAFDDVSQIV
ncbi:MAG: malonic semialdehyde reductase [Hoeflea sp.]|uniref:malonic semialdehyde reductase n=1 Tax=Hoeflea sp. TaxID=1940281 RepID=UPI0027305D1C|nr:malonic semialdehyde reductase [Hoeflea sp.]MDP2121378.1 malonic semialdehyde reductase [Hoeflea sp.]